MRARAAAAGVPDLAPALLVVALLVALATRDAGFPITAWAPVAIAVTAACAVRLAVAPPAWHALPRAVLVALAALAGYTAWSALSITWAQDKGIAWEGTNRTLLYLVLFALLALWPLRPGQAGAVAGAWALAMSVFAAVTLVDLTTASDPGRAFQFDRLLGPAGYVNASAALWFMAVWPAVLLAAARGVPWLLRGLFATGAVVLCEVALMSQSRGSVLAMPLTAVVLLVAVPGRVRTFYAVVVVAAATAAVARPLLDVGAANFGGRPIGGLVDHAVRSGLLAAAAAGVVVALVALVEGRTARHERVARYAHRGGAAVATAAVVAGAVVALAVVGSPTAAAHRAWDSFKGGYAEDTGSRLTSGLGSNRYDFYRVGVATFADHPLQGVGADNFKAQYMRRGRSGETPTYAHSVEIRTLASTGLVGALLLIAFLAACGVAARSAARVSAPAAAAAGAAAAPFVYWAIHGSGDWFWEFAGLGAPAFALLGVACALAPRRSPDTAGANAIARVGAVILGAALVVALALPWLAERDVQSAGASFAAAPGPSIARLHRAERLNGLDARPYLVEGAAWLRLGDVAEAQRAFTVAAHRNPGDFFPLLQLGAIASARGDAPRARRLLRQAGDLAPRDGLTAQATAVVRKHRRIDLVALQRAVLDAARAYQPR